MNTTIESSLERLAHAHEACAANMKECARLEGIRLELDATLRETRAAREALENKAHATSTGAATSEWLRQKLAGRDPGPPPSTATGADASAAHAKRVAELEAVESATVAALDLLATRMTRTGRQAPAFYAAVDGAALRVVACEAALIVPKVEEAATLLRGLVARVMAFRQLLISSGAHDLLVDLPDQGVIEAALGSSFPTAGEVAAAAADWKARARELATAPEEPTIEVAAE